MNLTDRSQRKAVKFHSVYMFFFSLAPFQRCVPRSVGTHRSVSLFLLCFLKAQRFRHDTAPASSRGRKTSNAGQRCNVEILRAADAKRLHQFRRVNAKRFAYRFCCGRLLSREDSAPSIIKGGIISARGKEGRVGPGGGGQREKPSRSHHS